MRKGKKISGGRYKKARKKKKYELAGQKRVVKLGEKKTKAKRVRGGNKRVFLLREKRINVIVNGKIKNIEIKNVTETPSNRFLARQNILTKGTILETELGRVKITNRPSQENVLNGILIEESKK